MKFKTSAKAIRNGYSKIISIGYCGAQALLHYQNPIAYTSGTYGWNFDLYEVDGIAICTGYRGMPGKSPNHALLMEYERLADKIGCDYTVPYEERKEQVNALLHEFIKTL